MIYTYDNMKLKVSPLEWDKNSGKEILQYCVGGLLYMPASQNIAEKIIDGRLDKVKSMVLDLEDSLGDDMVGFGQKKIVDTLSVLDSAIKDQNKQFSIENVPLIFIRIRSKGQMVEAIDSLGDLSYLLTGFNVPKFDKTNCDDYVEEFMQVHAKVKSEHNTELYIMPIIENKSAMYRQLRMDNLLYINNALRPISQQVLNIRVGGADFCALFGIRRAIDENIHEIGAVRSVFSDIINVFGKNYVVSGPVWEYFGKERGEAWEKGLINEIKYDKINGFIGKTSIHPSQLPAIQESLVVSDMDYQDAMMILGINVNTQGVKKSAYGNRMNEVKTHTKWAQKIVALARIYGVAD